MSRFQRGQWLDLGLGLLARVGPEVLTIERLCAEARKTRGSFYHHFESHEVFLDAMLQHWRQRDTAALISAAETKSRRAQDRLEIISRLAIGLDPALEIGIRRLAASSPGVALHLAAADAERLAYLVRAYRAAGWPAQQATALGQIDYAAYVGLQHLKPQADADWLWQLWNEFGRLIGRPKKSASS